MKGGKVKNNILILCLNNQYARQIAKGLSSELEMFYLDINDILEYNLINDDMLDYAGQDYFEKEKLKTIKGLTQYESTMFAGNFELLSQDQNLETLAKSAVIVYIGLTKDFLELQDKNSDEKFKHTLLAFEEEDNFCKSSADVVCNCNGNLNEDLIIIKNELVKYYDK